MSHSPLHRGRHETRPPGRIQRVIYGATRRLERHTIPLGIAVCAIGAAFAYIAWASISGVPFQDRYEVKVLVPTEAPIVQEGDTVRIAGRLAGLVTAVEPSEVDGAREVTAELRPQYAPIGRDATAKVRVKSIVYLTYLEIDPGNIDDPLPEGGTLALDQVGSNVDLLEVVELFDARSRDALRRAIYNAGVGLAGRGGQLNAALQDLRPGLENATPQLQAVAREDGAVARGVAGAARVASGLRGVRGDDVAALVGSGAAVVGTLAERRAELAASLELLRPLEDEFLATAPVLDPVLEDTIALTEELGPVIDDLATALPELNRVLALSDEIRLQVDRLTGFLRPVLREATPVIANLRVTVAAIVPLVRALATLVAEVEPYEADISGASANILSATKLRPDEGLAPGNPALRFTPVFGCHPARDPYPKPGAALRKRRPC